ncbi:MAG: ATP-binding cassette domain-containing protein [Bacteroidia bacterium]|jgi:cell division transport system ATP-binding protein
MERDLVIQLKDVQVMQGPNLVLSDVDIEIKRGEFWYLIGETGSGKSSLLKTLYGALPFEKGLGYIVDYDLSKLKEKEIPFLRRKLGIVFQDFQLLTDRSVFENLNFVLQATGWINENDIRIRIKEVLEQVGLATKDFKYPYELSGGEQQRVVIARALLNHPEIILADEPTGNLDPKVSDDIMTLLHQISKTGTSVLMATHDYRIIQKFPAKILKCEKGVVQETFALATF